MAYIFPNYTVKSQYDYISKLGFIMKKTIAIFEIILLLLVLVAFAWGRFDGKLSNPFYLEFTVNRVLLSVGITVAVIFRVSQLIKFVRTGNSTSLKLQLTALGLYFLMIGTDLFTYVKWNIYANMYFHISIILLTPVILGMITITINEIKKRKPNKTYKQ